MITQNTLDFLKALSQNNNREWFNANKNLYIQSQEEVLDFVSDLYEKMKEHDQIVEVPIKKVLFRIYRDIRFSKDKTPYKNYFAGRFQRDTQWLRGGYYFRITPGESFLAAGFWGPNSQDIKRIREHLAAEPNRINEIVQENRFQKSFGQIKGEKLKRIPRGFEADHPAAEWLKHKQFIVTKEFTDNEVTSEDFPALVNEYYQKVRPFFDYMSEILTTDLNGEPIYD